MTLRTTLVLTVGLAVVLLWLLAGCRVADQRHRAEDPNGRPRTSSAGSSGVDQHTEISNGEIVFIRHSDIYVMNSDGTVPEILRPVLGEYGFLNPVLAAAAMALSSVTVVSNALRLRGVKLG
jgi:hypothetical protein